MIYDKNRITFALIATLSLTSSQATAQTRAPTDSQAPSTTATTPEPDATSTTPADAQQIPSRIVLAPMRVPRLTVRTYGLDGRPINEPEQPVRRSVLDPDLPRPPRPPPAPDPVQAMRDTRTSVAIGATAGTAVGASLVLGFAMFWTLFGPTAEPFFVTTTVGIGGFIFGLPAVYYGVSSLYGGNGSYWSALGGGLLGLLIGGTVSAGAYFAGPGVGLIASTLLVPTSMIIGMSITYENSNTLRNAPQPQAPINRYVTSRIFPSVFATANAQGLVLSGSF